MQFISSDEPKCTENETRKNYLTKIGKSIEIECNVNASPSDNISFTWSQSSILNSKNKRFLTNFTSAAQKSVLKFNPQSAIDFGYVYCSARNIAGSQLEPCIFTVKPLIGEYCISG